MRYFTESDDCPFGMEHTQEPKLPHRQMASLSADRVKGGQNSGNAFPNAKAHLGKGDHQSVGWRAALSCPGMRSFFFRAVMEELPEKAVVVTAVVVDHFFCQQAGLRLMAASAQGLTKEANISDRSSSFGESCERTRRLGNCQAYARIFPNVVRCMYAGC
jgi:hypothetical protein